MRQTFTAITCNKAKRLFGKAPRHYGYTLMLGTLILHIIKGIDVEGVGWWPFNPPKQETQYTMGWYKYKSLALQRAQSLNNS